MRRRLTDTATVNGLDSVLPGADQTSAQRPAAAPRHFVLIEGRRPYRLVPGPTKQLVLSQGVSLSVSLSAEPSLGFGLAAAQ